MFEPDLGIFQPSDRSAWLDQVKAELKGNDYSALTWDHPEIGPIEPFPEHSDSAFKILVPPRSFRDETANWEIRQCFSADHDENAEVIKALAAGVSHLVIDVTKDTKLTDLTVLLQGVYLNMIGITLRGSSSYYRKKLFVEWLSKSNSGNAMRGSLLTDPILEAFGENTIAVDLAKSLIDHTQTIDHTEAQMRTVGIGAAQIFEAGGGDALEVAVALLIGSEYLDALTAKNQSIDDWAPKLEFQLAAGQSYFVTIAKFRALRYLWAHVVERYQPEHNCTIVTWIDALVSQRHFSANDQHNNLLRATTGALGALTGGCDSLEIPPFTPWESTNEGRRWARNIHHLLAEESGIDPNIDAGFGSKYIDNLTQKFIEKVMSYIAEVEHVGGINTMAGLDWLRSTMTTHQEALIQRFQLNKQSIIGVNLHQPIARVDEPGIDTSNWLAPIRLPFFQTNQASKL